MYEGNFNSTLNVLEHSFLRNTQHGFLFLNVKLQIIVIYINEGLRSIQCRH